MTLFLSTAILFISFWLAFFTPALSYCGLNAIFFTSRQLCNSLAISALAALLISSIMTGCMAFCHWQFPMYHDLLFAAAGFAQGILLCLFNENLLLNAPLKKGGLWFAIFLFCILFAFLSWLSPYITLTLLLIYLCFSAYDFMRNCKLPKTLLYNDGTTSNTGFGGDIKFRSKPNIYLFYLESMHSAKAMREIYGSDLGDNLAGWLESRNFTIYPEAHSNMDWTFDVRVNLFEMRYAQNFTLQAAKQEVPVVALDILADNGYAINIFESTPYVFGVFANQASFCSFSSSLPSSVLRKFKFAAPLFAQSFIWRLFTRKMNPGTLPELARMGECKETFQEYMKDTDSPAFNLIYFGPGHTDYYTGNSTLTPQAWPETYLRNFESACAAIKDYATYIDNHDPEAIVILLGDHGAHSLDYIWCHEADPEVALAKAGIDRNLLYLDLFSVFLAIKWPKGKEPHDFVPTTINLFLYLFKLLSGNEELAKYLQPDISMLSHKFKSFCVAGEKGKALQKLIPYSQYSQDDLPPTLMEKYKN